MTPTARPRKISRRLVIGAALVVVLGAIALDTKVVQTGSADDTRVQAFNPDAFGDKTFPHVQEVIDKKAVEALTLGPAVLADKDAAAKQYGTPSTTGAIMMVKLTGVASDPKSGIYTLTVDGLPPDIKVRVQTGPALNDTVLRDAPGDIDFGQFTNQIEYQDAGSALNRAMKKAVLDPVDVANLTGKTVEITGAFRLINPKNWLITPVRLAVK